MIRGYRRANGRLGARSHVLVLPSVVCSGRVAEEMAGPDAVAIVHQHGCGQVGPDVEHTRRLLAGTAANPNVAATVVIGLGCETNRSDALAERIRAEGQRVEVTSVQERGGSQSAITWGRGVVEHLTAEAAAVTREEASTDELVVGLDDPAAPFREDLEAIMDYSGSRLVVPESGRGPLCHPELAAEGAQVIVAWCGPGEGPCGFAVCPVLAVSGDADLHAALAGDFDLDGSGAPYAVAEALWRAVLATFGGELTAAERRGQRDFLLRRLARTM